MNYIIFYDENYKTQVKKEVGQFQSLSEGVGLLNDENFDDFKLDNEVKVFFDLLGVEPNSVEHLLKNAIFVRHFFKVDMIVDELSKKELQNLLEEHKESKIAVRVVFGKESAFKGLTQNISNDLEAIGYAIDVKEPDVVLSIYAGEKLFVSVEKKSNLVSNHRAGAPHYKVTDEISRAEFKLIEALDRYDIDLKNCKDALDLGASPGGWTHALAKLGINVSAVDPAELDDKVLSMSNVKHYKMLSQDFVKATNKKFDLLVDDMKMFCDKSSHIACNCVPLLSERAKLIMTLKLAETNLYKQILDALKILTQHFEIKSVKKLFHTRQEVLVYAQKRKSFS